MNKSSAAEDIGYTVLITQGTKMEIPAGMSETLLRPLKSLLRVRTALHFSAHRNSIRLSYDADLVPPPELMRTEGINVLEEWFRWAEEWSMFLRVFGGLRRRSEVLEIGCGLGRIAFSLRFLLREGSYEGFDISKRKIDFLNQTVHARYPNFHFSYADIKNTEYNPSGRIPATEFQFPYPDVQFDLVYAASVFTHMLPQACAHYFSEASRVLRPSGRFVVSFFLLDFYVPGHQRGLGFDSERFAFDHTLPSYDREFALVDPANPELMTAYSSSLIRKMAEKAGLVMSKDPVLGLWSGTQDSPIGGQDLVVLEKPALGSSS